MKVLSTALSRARPRRPTRRASRPRCRSRPRRSDVRPAGPKGCAAGEHVLALGLRHLPASNEPPGRRAHASRHRVRPLPPLARGRAVLPVRRYRWVDAAGRATRPRRGSSLSRRSVPTSLGSDRRASRRGPSIRRRRDRDHLDGGRGARRRWTVRLLLAIDGRSREPPGSSANSHRAAASAPRCTWPVLTGEVGGILRRCLPRRRDDTPPSSSRRRETRRQLPLSGYALERIEFSYASRSRISGFSDCVAAPRRCTSSRSRPSPERMAEPPKGPPAGPRLKVA